MTDQALIARLTTALTPVTPRPEFVRELGAQLLERARQAQATPTLTLAQRWLAVPRPVLWLAAGVGAVLSVLGVIAMLRHRATAPQTPRLAH